MNIVLLSGGSGKRLWPLSNETRSKQFLKLLVNEAHEAESMVQRVYRQIQKANTNAKIVVATGKAQLDSIRSQLGFTVDVVCEPERRDTFPAIALASSYLALDKRISPDETIIVMPCDPYADIGYFNNIVKIDETLKSGAANMVLMGIKPEYPSAKYGYIIPKKDQSGDVKLIERFYEKPEEATAAALIGEGALWNAGVFAFKLGYLMELISKYIEFKTFSDVEKQYSKLPKISFDYEVVEKEKSIAMVEYAGTWMDIGTWNTLTEVMDRNAVGKVIFDDTCENTHVINELDIPITVMGAKNMVIAASPDGILVSDKHQSSYMKPLVESIQQRPMFEERRWGEYKVIDYVAYGDGTSSLTKHLYVKAGKSISYQMHSIRDEIWTIVDGTGDLLIDGHVRNVKRGDVAYITKGQKHAIRAVTDLRFIEVQIGEELVESDIVHLEWAWV